jgi:hypothetical protein
MTSVWLRSPEKNGCDFKKRIRVKSRPLVELKSCPWETVGKNHQPRGRLLINAKDIIPYDTFEEIGG